MTQIKKTHPVTIQTVGKNRVVALVSAFGNTDFQGDRVVKGAFAADIKRWQQSGDKVPFLWAHDWNDPYAHLGTCDPYKMRETNDGLLVEAEVDNDTDFSKQVLKLLRERRVTQFSFAYDVLPGGEHKADDFANELTSLHIIEAGPCLVGANDQTQLLDVKSAQALFARESVPARKCGCSALQLCKAHEFRLGNKLGTKRVNCPDCGQQHLLEVQPPVEGGTVPFVLTPCCQELLGWSGKMSTADHVKEMALVRQHVGAKRIDPEVAAYKAQLEAILADWSPESRRFEQVGGHDEIRAINAELARLDPNTKKIRSDISDRRLEEKIRMTYSAVDRNLLDQLDAIDPAGQKHTPRQASESSRACSDGAAVALEVRDRVTYPSQDSRLLRAATELRGFAEALRLDGADSERVAREAAQRGQVLLEVAEILTAAGHDVQDLVRAGERIVTSCSSVAGPARASLEMVGSSKTVIPAKMYIIEEQATAQPVDEEHFSLEIGQVPTDSFRLEDAPDGAPVPAGSSTETFTFDAAGVVDSTVTHTEGEGDTWRVAVDGQGNSDGELRLEIEE